MDEDKTNNFWTGNSPEHGFTSPPTTTSSSYFGEENTYNSNASTAAMNNSRQIENYTVLSDGYGNYIKVYHQTNEDVNLNNPNNKYECFSSNNFVQPNFNYMFQTQQTNDNNCVNQHVEGTNTNMLINQLVGNWSPNISGTYSPFGTAPIVNEPLQSNLPTVPTTAPISQPTPSQLKLPNSGFNNQNNENTMKINQNVKKQRIVAEVKPMRMSYSDVLSKNVAVTTGTSSTNAKTPSPNPTNGNGNGTPIIKSSKSEKSGKGNVFERRDEKFNKKNIQNINNSSGNQTGNATEQKPMRKSAPPPYEQVRADTSAKNGSVQDKNTSTGSKKSAKGKMKAKSFAHENMNANKKVHHLVIEDNLVENEDDDDGENDDDEDGNEDSYAEYDDSPDFMYNVKKNIQTDTHIEKISKPQSYKKSRFVNRANSKQEKISSSYSAKRNQRSKKNQKYAFMEKLLSKWIEYMIIVLSWLWSLISDVVYLSFRLIWDKIIVGFQFSKQYFDTIKNEFNNNSGRPSAWFKNMWKKFDSKFKKESKWAFWRCRKKPVEPTKNYYKDGRLPTTADEAMSSLLNCKGKDAYSILGVSPDCSQEQIRKHYKKIAVLVHPDKNKQPGAEEAFKVLQRSFELIGEPENRKSYDQSLAEALNAEKAWSEINDLLTQLHTKISEAANTIRCSSCCLRHPRKPTGRPHFAARECNSCKIRHSAREGDIWAETSFFGLRWKYLALMEGNVYDITEWANCQKGALSHLQPNSHIVQYRIVLGGNNQQQEKEKARKEPPQNETNLDDFLNNIYGGQNQQSQSSSRRRYRRN